MRRRFDELKSCLVLRSCSCFRYLMAISFLTVLAVTSLDGSLAQVATPPPISQGDQFYDPVSGLSNRCSAFVIGDTQRLSINCQTDRSYLVDFDGDTFSIRLFLDQRITRETVSGTLMSIDVVPTELALFFQHTRQCDEDPSCDIPQALSSITGLGSESETPDEIWTVHQIESNALAGPPSVLERQIQETGAFLVRFDNVISIWFQIEAGPRSSARSSIIAFLVSEL